MRIVTHYIRVTKQYDKKTEIDILFGLLCGWFVKGIFTNDMLVFFWLNKYMELRGGGVVLVIYLIGL